MSETLWTGSGVASVDLHDACQLALVEVVKQALATGADVERRDAHGRTPLMLACRAGSFEVVKLLVEAGADVKAANAGGTTCLMYAKTAAVGSGDLRTLDLLLAAGADPNCRDASCRTALDYLVERSALVIRYLQSRGAEA
jgi:ankyrin repeat protein